MAVNFSDYSVKALSMLLLLMLLCLSGCGETNGFRGTLQEEGLSGGIIGGPEAPDKPRKKFYIMTASNALHGCEYGTDKGMRMDMEQMLKKLDELQGFVFNENLMQGSFTYRDSLLDGEHLVFSFLDEEPEKIEVRYIIGDAIAQEHYLHDYPIKVPEKPGSYNFFAELTWNSGDNETVFFRVTVVEDRGKTGPPTAKDLAINYSDFDLLANHIEKTLFEYDYAIIREDPGKLGKPYAVQGKYDLNSDGTIDEIQVNFSSLSAAYGIGESSKIKINDTEVESYFDNPRGVYLVDFYKEDSFTELVIFDEGPSGDPRIFLYRYNGKEIVELGIISGEISCYERPAEIKNDEATKFALPAPFGGPIIIDGKGRILSPTDVAAFIAPEIFFRITEIKDNGMEHTRLDYREMLYQEYELKKDFQTYFKEIETDTELFSSLEWDVRNIVPFSQGEKIFLKGIDNLGKKFLVERENGKKGLMYFWIGD